MKLRESTKTTLFKLGFEQPTAPQERTNPFTLRKHVLEPEAVQLYDFITTRKFVCGKDYTRQAWDNARYYFCTKWPTEYFELLD